MDSNNIIDIVQVSVVSRQLQTQLRARALLSLTFTHRLGPGLTLPLGANSQMS